MLALIASHPQITAVALIALLLLLILTYSKLRKHRHAFNALATKYAPIENIQSHCDALKAEATTIENDIITLKEDYQAKKAVFTRLVKEAAVYDEEIKLAEMGFYKPHFDFDTAEHYKDAIKANKEQQKAMLQNGTAIFCNTQWTVDGSEAKGRTKTNRGIKLTARAFNNECDAAIANTRWNNGERMEDRIERAFNAINTLNRNTHIHIANDFLQLKLEQLRLTLDYAEQKQDEKEEQQEIRRQMREEAKLEKEKDNAIKEEEKYNKLLAKAKADADKATGAKLDTLQSQIATLSEELRIAQEKAERAKSMAEQTKRGHVYVISNIGSFGENIYKIGMTRRLDPTLRIVELGDASVPFVFDVHAMIFSENAPELEKTLHNTFADKRVNMVNMRKEFFSVTLDEIEAAVADIDDEVEFIRTAEARDYYETQSMLAQRNNHTPVEEVIEAFPDEI